MSALSYHVQHMPDPAFWQALADHPEPHGQYPRPLTLGSRIAFVFAPFNTQEGYADFGNPKRGMHLVVPSTPAPITSMGYLFGPPTGMSRRMFVAFFYRSNEAVLAECSPIVMLHKPLGLRLQSGAVYTDFSVASAVLKGDDAPINLLYASPSNPDLSLVIREEADFAGKSNLNIQLRVPMLASMTVNPPAQARLPI